MNSIITLAEKSLKTWLATQDIGDIPTANIFRAFDSAARVLPAIAVQAESAEPVSKTAGTWKIPLRVEVRSQADDSTEDAHHTRVEKVFDLLHAGDLSANLSAALTGFECQFAVTEGAMHAVDNRQWTSSLRLTLWCGASDLT